MYKKANEIAFHEAGHILAGRIFPMQGAKVENSRGYVLVQSELPESELGELRESIKFHTKNWSIPLEFHKLHSILQYSSIAGHWVDMMLGGIAGQTVYRKTINEDDSFISIITGHRNYLGGFLTRRVPTFMMKYETVSPMKDVETILHFFSSLGVGCIDSNKFYREALCNQHIYPTDIPDKEFSSVVFRYILERVYYLADDFERNNPGRLRALARDLRKNRWIGKKQIDHRKSGLIKLGDVSSFLLVVDFIISNIRWIILIGIVGCCIYILVNKFI